ncbi:unnamed protein product [Lupinus luteus]|uniref:Uncharacterized protein n=1 Tax=Lupinus luteus TaxID=3873 RepID=A0AAV1XT68_LUPLU
MASSSKSKKQHTNACQRSQGTTSLESDPLDLTRLLANDEQHKIFEEHFHGRTIFTPKYGNIVKFEIEDFLFPYVLRQQNHFYFYRETNDIYPELVQINWTKMIMRKMWNVRGTQSPLPYVIFITNILEHFGVSANGETKVPLNLCESKIDVEVVHKMCFSADHRDHSGRTYRHRSDREHAPADQTEPNPPTPQPSEFHAQSSSFDVMPTNQMIIDELLSLRGYITNQMDAFNTQNQPIQFELHCLSSKLSSMDVDEDSSELES